MAGHLPIATTAEHSNLLLELNKIKEIQSLPHFMRVRGTNGTFMNLPVNEYNMDEETGLKDEYVISFTPSHMEHILEIHLNSEGKINQVYLVM